MTSPSLLPGTVGSAKQQIQVVDFFFHVDIFEKAELMLFSQLSSLDGHFRLIPVLLQNQSYRTEEVGHPHMKTPGWKGKVVRPQNKQFKNS